MPTLEPLYLAASDEGLLKGEPTSSKIEKNNNKNGRLIVLSGRTHLKGNRKRLLGTPSSGKADTELTPPYQSSEPPF